MHDDLTQPADDGEQAMAERLMDLEVRYTHLQRIGEDLSEVLLAQAKQIEELERQLTRLATRTSQLESSQDDAPRRLEDERPPHY